MIRIAALASLLLLAACGETVTVSERPPVSYADIQPASGLTYPEFRRHDMGTGDGHMAQKRFIVLDRDNNGRLSKDELGGL